MFSQAYVSTWSLIALVLNDTEIGLSIGSLMTGFSRAPFFDTFGVIHGDNSSFSFSLSSWSSSSSLSLSRLPCHSLR